MASLFVKLRKIEKCQNSQKKHFRAKLGGLRLGELLGILPFCFFIWLPRKPREFNGISDSRNSVTGPAGLAPNLNFVFLQGQLFCVFDVVPHANRFELLYSADDTRVYCQTPLGICNKSCFSPNHSGNMMRGTWLLCKKRFWRQKGRTGDLHDPD